MTVPPLGVLAFCVCAIYRIQTFYIQGAPSTTQLRSNSILHRMQEGKAFSRGVQRPPKARICIWLKADAQSSGPHYPVTHFPSKFPFFFPTTEAQISPLGTNKDTD